MTAKLSDTVQLDETMSPDDHMLTADLAAYFRTARGGLAAVENGLAAAGWIPEEVRAVLDFGCGYGRVYRALAAGLPQAQLTAADLMESAARFCAETFGGDWVKSYEDLDQVQLPRTYDLVWLGSVFTHLPAYRWWTMLRFLARATRSAGLVVFTSHGDRAIEVIQDFGLKRNPNLVDRARFALMQEAIGTVGFDFIANRTNAIQHQHKQGIDVSLGEYGFSFAAEWWIREAIARDPDFELVHYAPAGWGNNHDAITMRRR